MHDVGDGGGDGTDNEKAPFVFVPSSNLRCYRARSRSGRASRLLWGMLLLLLLLLTIRMMMMLCRCLDDALVNCACV